MPKVSWVFPGRKLWLKRASYLVLLYLVVPEVSKQTATNTTVLKHMRVSINGGLPKWMVYKGKSQ